MARRFLLTNATLHLEKGQTVVFQQNIYLFPTVPSKCHLISVKLREISIFNFVYQPVQKDMFSFREKSLFSSDMFVTIGVLLQVTFIWLSDVYCINVLAKCKQETVRGKKDGVGRQGNIQMYTLLSLCLSTLNAQPSMQLR